MSPISHPQYAPNSDDRQPAKAGFLIVADGFEPSVAEASVPVLGKPSAHAPWANEKSRRGLGLIRLLEGIIREGEA